MTSLTQENSDQLMKGFGLQQAGRLDDAERLYRLVLSTSPDNVHALNLLGVLCVNSARPQEALPLIEHAGKIDPRDADTWSNLGLALKDLRQL